MKAVTNKCLILAAGNGRRLRSQSTGVPKPLVRVHGVPLLEHVLLNAHEAGIDEFVIVLGYRGGMIRRWFASRTFKGIKVTWVENLDYFKDNGVSVLKARDELRDPFLLLMSDHLFEPKTATALLTQPLAHGQVILAVDRKVSSVFDLDDATKVRCDGDLIVDIGKNIASYDALDTGMFLCCRSLFETLESALKDGNCSLSDGMRNLSRDRRFRAFDVGDAKWQDVDTPEALAYAEAIFDRHFCRTPSREMLASA
jgi:choline kinase